MILYFSGVQADKFEEYYQQIPAGKKLDRCMSFYYVNNEKRQLKWLETFLKNGQKVMMDSGAFSFQKRWHRGAHDKKLVVETKAFLKDYIAFCKQYKDQLAMYVTFDYERKIDVTWNVTKEIYDEGLHKVVPVFHGIGELDEVITRYRKLGVTYYGVAGLANKLLSRRKHLIYSYVRGYFKKLEKYGFQSHGFGLSRVDLLFAFPWTSVDSSTWIVHGRMGNVMDITFKPTKLIALHMSKDRGLSSRSTGNYWRLSKQARRPWDEKFEKRGFNAEQMSKDPAARVLFNAMMYTERANSYGKKKSDEYVYKGLFE